MSCYDSLNSCKGAAVSVLKRVILFALLGSLRAPACPAGDDPPLGQIVEKVACKSDPGQSYALYLPSSYSPSRSWPILFCLDPGARGRVPVDLFRAAAEQYGYIVVGSNNSRNGPQGQNTAAMKAMWEDTQDRFAIDPARIFAAGMSGGARVACGFAQGSPLFAGVIAFAAGFPNAQTPVKVPFFFFGAAGIDDFNYPEMRRLDDELDKLGAIKRTVTFDGGHGWPPAEVCTRGIEWLELQSMKAGKRPRDETLIDSLYRKAVASAHAAEGKGGSGEVYLLEKALVEDFRGLKDVSEFENGLARLAASREVKRFLQDEKEQQAGQYRRQAELMGSWTRRYNGDESADAIPRFESLLSELKRQAQAPEDSSRRRVARRVLEGTYIGAYEESRSLLAHLDYRAAARMLELSAAIHADRPQLLYNLATVYAKGRDRKSAIDALKRAVEQGFRDSVALEHEEAFNFLRGDPALKSLLQKIGKQQ
jgi:predicted esterase